MEGTMKRNEKLSWITSRLFSNDEWRYAFPGHVMQTRARQVLLCLARSLIPQVITEGRSRAAASTVNLTSVSGDISVVGYLDCKNAECESYEALSLMFVDHPRLVELCRRCTG